MATLSQMCILPEGWDAPSVSMQIGMSKKLAWKTAKRVERERMAAYRERERKRAKRNGIVGASLESDRRRVYRATSADTIEIENHGKMFYLCQGVRSPKKAKNRASKEQAGTIGWTIVVKRFEGSRLTCVCKSMVY